MQKSLPMNLWSGAAFNALELRSAGDLCACVSERERARGGARAEERAGKREQKPKELWRGERNGGRERERGGQLRESGGQKERG
eukprot:6176680-Pleurochrysis_carterae.AAC.2